MADTQQVYQSFDQLPPELQQAVMAQAGVRYQRDIPALQAQLMSNNALATQLMQAAGINTGASGFDNGDPRSSVDWMSTATANAGGPSVQAPTKGDRATSATQASASDGDADDSPPLPPRRSRGTNNGPDNISNSKATPDQDILPPLARGQMMNNGVGVVQQAAPPVNKSPLIMGNPIQQALYSMFMGGAPDASAEASPAMPEASAPSPTDVPPLARPVQEGDAPVIQENDAANRAEKPIDYAERSAAMRDARANMSYGDIAKDALANAFGRGSSSDKSVLQRRQKKRNEDNTSDTTREKNRARNMSKDK